MGYLEGTQKAGHTIKNYRSDLAGFQQFLEKGLSRQPVALSRLSREDLNRYHDHLKSLGLKTNTRRRKLLTVRRLLRYLAKRNQLSIDVGDRLATPHKSERVPRTLLREQLLATIRALPVQAELEERNRVLLWTLAETGCQVSEVTRLRFDDWSAAGGKHTLSLSGKAPRTLVVSGELYEAVQSLRARSGGRPWLFLGFNKFGALGAPITPRGVELLVRAYAERLTGAGEELTPRTFRHSAVVSWFREGVSREEIQKRLGLKTPYAFRAYEPLFKSIAPATSTDGTHPSES